MTDITSESLEILREEKMKECSDVCIRIYDLNVEQTELEQRRDALKEELAHIDASIGYYKERFDK